MFQKTDIGQRVDLVVSKNDNELFDGRHTTIFLNGEKVLDTIGFSLELNNAFSVIRIHYANRPDTVSMDVRIKAK